MEQIIRNKFAELNESASAKWEDNKELSLERYKNENGNIYITIGIGKWNTTYHDVQIDTQSLKYVVIRESKRNAILYDVILYVIMPLVSI